MNFRKTALKESDRKFNLSLDYFLKLFRNRFLYYWIGVCVEYDVFIPI